MAFQNMWTGGVSGHGILKEMDHWESEGRCLPCRVVVVFLISFRIQGDCGTRHVMLSSIWVVALHLDLEKSTRIVASSCSFFVWAFPRENDWTLWLGLANAITVYGGCCRIIGRGSACSAEEAKGRGYERRQGKACANMLACLPHIPTLMHTWLFVLCPVTHSRK